MSTARRGRGGERGSRGGGRGTSTPRGNFTGTRTNRERTTTPPAGPRAQNGGPRGGVQRGGFNQRSDSSNGLRGRMTPHTTINSSSGIMNTTPHADTDYQARFNYLKEDRPSQRERLVEEGRMNPEGPMKLSDAVKLIGLCNDMCPEHERVQRIVENNLFTPEFTSESLAQGNRAQRVPDESRMVKAFKRSAAGDDIELVTDIRTPATCLKSIKYMMSRLDNEDLPFLHGWLWDRLRAVRRDLRTQAVDKVDDINVYLECFEQCARFHLISPHHMSGAGSSEYFKQDYQQDIEQLLHTNLSLKERYADNRSAKIISQNEAEFQAYRLILALHTNDTLVEYELQNLPMHLRRNGRVKVALQIYQAGKTVIHTKSRTLVQARQNWKDFWKLVQSPAVSYLMACAAEIFFNRVRHVVLDTIYRAYRQGNVNRIIKMEDWTVSELIHVLGFDCRQQVTDFCELYGFSFGTTAAGVTFLDINSLPYSTGPLKEPAERKPQTLSKFVESKRYGRNLSAVVRGMSVQVAKSNGLVGEADINTSLEQEQDMEEEDSLFIPDTFTVKPLGSGTDTGVSDLTSGATAVSSNATPFNPFATSSTPTTTPPSLFNTGTPASVPANPFLAKTTAPANPFGTSPGQSVFSSNGNATAGKPPPFGTPSGSSLFNTPNSTTNEPPKSGFGLPSFSQQTPFGLAGTKPTTTISPATGQSVQPGLFDASKNSISFATPNAVSPFSNLGSKSPFASSSTTSAEVAKPATPKPKAPFMFQSSSTTDDRSKGGSTEFSPFPNSPAIPASKGQSNGIPPFSTFPQASAAPGAAFPSFFSAPQESSNAQQPSPSQEEDEQRAQREQERVTKEAQEARDRIAQETQVQEARQRAKAALQRAQKEKEERQRLEAQKAQLAQQQQEQQQKQQKQQEQEREDRIQREKEATLTAIATDLVHDPMEGLLKQFVENQVTNLFYEIEACVRWEKLTEHANKRYHQIQVTRTRRFFAHWVAMTGKKKRTRQARERRKWLKENATALLALKNEAESKDMLAIEANGVQAKTKIAVASQSKTVPAIFKKPQVPASASPWVQQATPKQQRKAPIVRTAPAVNNIRHNTSISERNNMILYKNPRAPIDRTQSDYFKLRAAGIVPTQPQKRSLDSAEDQEEEAEAERKRRRKSTSETPQVLATRQSLPPPTTDEERFARFRALKEKLGKSTSVPRTSNVARSINSRASTMIAQARELFSGASTPKPSPLKMRHEFSQSVPDLGGSPSAFGKSVGSSTLNDRPAYWARKSRFVPQHLYGKGGEAVIEYHQSYRRSTSVSTEPQETLGPLQLSSPDVKQQSYVPFQLTSPIEEQQLYVPLQLSTPTETQYDHLQLTSPMETQQSYVPEQFMGGFDSPVGSDSQVRSFGTGDEGEGELEDDEEMSYDEEDDGEDEEDEEDDGLSTGIYGAYPDVDYGYGEQNAQMVSGATQDDAIELSD
ncbi:hypothetical protein K504DRAFT_457375 [Pleomassaria siparia CBS 279.74]|uniref:SAC3/GANP/THP3 conserved domain-containing protein n=1 Tax=Pleomassaria siparia CBS 279.74 TaxID=1314801 RepID=A0A6G1KRU5_9PLEO|nr:hypothetical protein K504DRAFT_457375 [Pleomassaria siparia CBS 279.74]